jgi:hypothetical protein
MRRNLSADGGLCPVRPAKMGIIPLLDWEEEGNMANVGTLFN